MNVLISMVGVFMCLWSLWKIQTGVISSILLCALGVGVFMRKRYARYIAAVLFFLSIVFYVLYLHQTPKIDGTVTYIKTQVEESIASQKETTVLETIAGMKEYRTEDAKRRYQMQENYKAEVYGMLALAILFFLILIMPELRNVVGKRSS